MTETEDEGDLIARVRDLLPTSERLVLLGVEGNEGVGKSTVASSVGAALAAPVLHFDSYAMPHRGRYPDSIRYEDLRADVERLAGTPGLVVVEGVCLRQVLERISLQPRVTVYIKLFNARGRWVGADTCDESSLMPEEIAPVDPSAPGSIERDVRAYHARYRPISRADIIHKVVRQYA